MRDCEDQVHVGYRKEFPLPGGQPPFSGIVQTIPTMPVPAAVVGEGDGFSAFGTLIQVPAECGRPALFDCGEHLQVLTWLKGLTFPDEVFACRTNNIRHLNGWLISRLSISPHSDLPCVRSRTAS